MIRELTLEESKLVEETPTGDTVGIQQWGVKKNLEYNGENLGDCFLFHLLVPDSLVKDGEMTLKTIDGRDGSKVCFKLDIGKYPKYFEYSPSELRTHYLGQLSCGAHVVEMVGRLKSEETGNIDMIRDAIKKGKTRLQFSIL